MAQPKTATVIRQLGLSPTLATIADQKAARLGISTPEYIRYLIVQDTENKRANVSLSSAAAQEFLRTLLHFLAAEKSLPTVPAKTADTK
jgi:hypothetical protein